MPQGCKNKEFALLFSLSARFSDTHYAVKKYEKQTQKPLHIYCATDNGHCKIVCKWLLDALFTDCRDLYLDGANNPSASKFTLYL